MTDEPPDYMGMNGAEFQRAVGTDPEKWAEAFTQREFRHQMGLDSVHGGMVFANDAHEIRAVLAQWFRDAMEAAVKAARQEWPPDPEWEENRRRARVAREHEVARRHSGGPSD